MQSWFTFELDGETCRVERESTLGTLADFLARLDPCFASFADHDPRLAPRLVVMGVREGERHRFRIVDAGLVLLPMLADRQIWTPEGIRNAEPEHPVNLALQGTSFECSSDRLDAVVALTFEGYYRPDLRRQGQVNDQFDAIATRSANVPAIREAAVQVFASTEQLRHEAARRAERQGQESWVWTGRTDIFGDRFTRGLFRLAEGSSLQYVDGSKRRFLRPGNLVELLKQMRDYPSALLLAGGTGLGPRLAGSAEVPDLISLEGVRELTTVETSEDQWEVGAAVPLTQVAEHLGRECLAFNKALRRFATRPVRNRATLGGYLATAWSVGQLAPLLMALNARARLLSADGERDVPVSQLFVGEGRTLLQPGELIRSLAIPRATETALASRGTTAQICDVYTVAPRRTGSAPYATAAFAIELRERRVVKARLAYSGVARTPQRAREAEDFLAGRNWGEKAVVEALPILLRSVSVEAPGDGRVEAGYLRQLVGTLFQKFHLQHPAPGSVRPETLTATGEFAKLDEPFYEAPV
jgi:xanthine dehydrogenase iron-sulfur cluster and FAD-binding subunit A